MLKHMMNYGKIETVFNRDVLGTKKLIPGSYCNATVEYLKDAQWVWTEKVNGVNIRVHWDGYKVEFGGRNDKTEISAPLIEKLNEYFGGEENAQVFEQVFRDRDAILFGEGFGSGIQKEGGQYKRDGVDFILFDVYIGGTYMTRHIVNAVARSFGVNAVPVVGRGTLGEAITFVQGKPQSVVAKMMDADTSLVMEGVVCRPKVELLTREGERVICKIKLRDFENMKQVHLKEEEE